MRVGAGACILAKILKKRANDALFAFERKPPHLWGRRIPFCQEDKRMHRRAWEEKACEQIARERGDKRGAGENSKIFLFFCKKRSIFLMGSGCIMRRIKREVLR